MRISRLSGSLFFVLPLLLKAADTFVPVPGGTSLFPQNVESDFYLSNSPAFGEKKSVPVSGLPVVF
jgi:hypothetical protein